MMKKIMVFILMSIAILTAGCVNKYNTSGFEDNGTIINSLENRSVIVDGNVTADSFIGDGNKLTNLNINSTIGELINSTRVWNSTGGNVYLNDSTGSIGIRTSTPGSALEVIGGVEIDNLFDNDGSNFFDLSGQGADKTLLSISSTGAVTFEDISIVELQISDLDHYTTADFIIDLGNVNDSISLWNRTKLGIIARESNKVINASGNNITNVGAIEAPDGSAIRFSAPDPFTGVDIAINIMSNQLLPEGEISHIFTDLPGEKILRTWQVGLPDGAGFMRNSQIISSDFGITNGTKLSRCSEMANQMGGPDGLNLDGVGCNTTDLGAALFVEGSVRIGHRLVVGGGNNSVYGIQSQGFADFNMEGGDFEIFNGSLHPFTPRIEEVGFATGELVTMIDEDFEDNDISPFQKREQVGSDLDNWDVDIDTSFCFEDECARAKGGDSRSPRIMEHNVTTINRNKLNLTFWIGARAIDTIDNLSVQVINGASSVMIYNFTGTGAASNTDISPPEFITALIPSSFDNQAKISIRFNMSANFGGTSNSREEFWVDNVKLVGTATASTRQNVTRRDTTIKCGFGDFTCFFWNDSSKVLTLAGNTSIISETIQDLIVSGLFTLGTRTITSFFDIVQTDDLDIVNLTMLDNGTILRLNTSLYQVGFINGTFDLNTTGFINASRLDGSIDCSNIDGGSDLDFCVDGGGGTSVWNSSGSDVYLNDSTGKVGIGAIPNYKLTVFGSMNLTGNLTMNSFSTSTGEQIFASSAKPTKPAYSFERDKDSGFFLSGGGRLGWATDGQEKMTLTQQLKISLSGSASLPAYAFGNDDNTGIYLPLDDELGFASGGLEFLRFEEDTQDEVQFNDGGVDIDFNIQTNNNANMFFIDGGTDRIGIGTNTPGSTLHIIGDVNISGTLNVSGDVGIGGDLIITGTCISEGVDCNTDIAELMHSKASADNTSCIVTPEHQRTITNNFYNATRQECEFQLVGAFYEEVCNDVSVKVEFNNVNDICGESFEPIEGNEGKFNKITICQNTTSTYTEDELITIPKKVSCNLNTFFVKEFESGDVVCSDTDAQRIKYCNSAYDTSVIGVVNYEATMILNQRAPYPVALVGNVPIKVKCDTAINVGDLLVSSNTQGYAQSVKTVTPTTLAQVWSKMGSPFCKALQSCNSGTATIRCLLT